MYRHTKAGVSNALRVPAGAPTHTGCCGCSAGTGVSSLCRNWQHHLLKRVVRATGSQALLLPQCRGTFRYVCALHGRKTGPLLQGFCVSLDTGEGSRVAAGRAGMLIRGTQSVWFGHELCSAALLFLSQPSEFSHRDTATEHRCIGRDSVNSFLCEVLEGCNSLLKYLQGKALVPCNSL